MPCAARPSAATTRVRASSWAPRASPIRSPAASTGQNAWKHSGKADSPYVEEHRQFIKSIRAGEPLNCGDYMARSTMVVVMGQMSCYSGKEVTWDQVNKSDYFIPPKPEECTWEMEPPTQPDAKGVYPVCAVPGFTKNV